MYYRHDLKRTRDICVDENFDFVPDGRAFKVKRALLAAFLRAVVFPLTRLTHGLRIYGRHHLKEHKEELKNGAITVSNHVFMWDYLCVLKAIRPHISHFPAWKPNFESGFQPFMRLLGGMPIPEGDGRAMRAFKKGLDEVVVFLSRYPSAQAGGVRLRRQISQAPHSHLHVLPSPQGLPQAVRQRAAC